jgi:hypothetical protein
MEFSYSETTVNLLAKLNAFIADHVAPRNSQYMRESEAGV